MEKSPHLILYALLFSFSMLVPVLSNESSNTVPFHVGVVLDATSLIGKTGNTSISIAMHDFYSQHGNYTTRLVLHSRDSGNETIRAVSAALDLMENEHVQVIIGPQRSAQGLFVSNLGNAARVPVISFSATSPALIASSHTPNYFIRTASDDSAQVNAISSIVKAFGWRKVVLIYEDTGFGIGIISYLIDALQNVDALVPYRSVLSITSTEERILGELYKLMTMQTRVFIVHMSPALGSRLFLSAKEIGMMGSGYVWIMTDGLTSILESMDSLPIGSMQGVLGVRHYIQKSKRLDDFKTRWKWQFRLRNQESSGTQPSIYAVWAYDTVWLLAEAVEEIASSIKPQQRKSTNNSNVSLENLPISEVGRLLLEAILNKTKLDAISGEFVIKNNQLQVSTFEIVNINGTDGKAIGYWTPEYGINRTLSSHGAKKKYSTSRFDLDTVLWPGGSASVPKGWIMPTNEKNLKIGVPVKDAFFEFVKTERDPLTNATKFTGYTIDVFEAVLKVLPYAVSYEFVAFENSSTGQMAGTYDGLVNQVYEQIYDAVVGDVTITENRSKYVDFTLPFLESGVAMIVPIRKYRDKNIWNFVEPLTTELWFGILAFFIYTSFVLCIIEPESNNDFTGTTSERIGTISYFIFSTMVFAHRDGVKSNFSRMVVIVWVFVVLVLVSSYTANLTSLLTVVKIRPLIKDVNQLIKNENWVGYKKGSFLDKYLRPIFLESKMRALRGPREYIEALTDRSNESVAVVFHEVPYIKVFLSRYCNEYVMINLNRTAGFGFVFPKGSPLVADISKAILNLTEGDEIVKIEKKWFGNSCRKQANDISFQILTFESFGALYLITGVTSFLSLLISIAFFIYNERSILRTISGDDSIWQTSKSWAKYYYKGETEIVEENSTHRGKSSSPHKDNFGGSEIEFSTSSYGNSTPTTEASSSRHHGSPHCFGQPMENSTVKPR